MMYKVSMTERIEWGEIVQTAEPPDRHRIHPRRAARWKLAFDRAQASAVKFRLGAVRREAVAGYLTR
jgi:hypothetical protein